ncbi:hypothetical protein TWF718_000142 [Orbilia javanica]|uniref:Aminoglycoside phosphotransferase domain-containing protein n=1 Tax=Orbilia javanica TaxID=47235 RepID=A0AAN8N7K8_9PEZI
MLLTFDLSLTPRPLPSNFQPKPLHPVHKTYLDLRIYIARTLYRFFSFLQRVFSSWVSKKNDRYVKGKGSSNPGFRVARISGGYYIKWGVRDVEARAMAFVRENTGVPVPRVLGFWSHREETSSKTGSTLSGGKDQSETKRETSGSSELNYMLIEALPGDPVGEVWEAMDDAAKEKFKQEFVRYLRELRALGQQAVQAGGVAVKESSSSGGVDGEVRLGYIGAINHQPLTDHRIATVPYGPFEDVEEWLECEYLLGYVAKARPREVYERLERELKKKDVRVVFTHSDFTPRNVLVEKESGRITGIVDWDSAGWCVEWWEGVKGVYGWNDGSFAQKRDDSDKEAAGPREDGLMEIWKALLTEVVGDFADELKADEEMRDIYGFPY